MVRLLKSAAMVTSLMVSVSLNADNPPSGIFINPQLGFFTFDSDRNVDAALFPGIGIGYQFENSWALEVNFISGDTDVDGPGNADVDFKQFHLAGLYHFPGTNTLQPYAAFGIGANEFDTAFGKADETAINIGGGIKYFLNPALSLRTDLRLFNSFDEEDQDLALSVGLHYSFGSTASPITPVANTKPGPFVDSDGDGVVDSEDQCPNTPANTPVSAYGCPVDSDGDGVADNHDQCPGSEAGARVDERGCYIVLQETRTIELEINFANNSAEIGEQYINEIQQVADFMREYPLTNVVVEGHTDDRGEASYNQQLSERRARAVATALINRFNIDAARVSAVGKGEAEPIADNSTTAGRAANRRVVGVISATVETRAQ